jgi:hypothetical protein
MRALVSLILSSMMLNLSAQARSSATSSDDSTSNQNMEEDFEQEIQDKNPSPQKMEDFYSGKYPKRQFKGYNKYPKTRLPDSNPQEILQTED